MDTLLPIKLPPGMRNTGTAYQSKGRWYTGNLVRFFQDTIQPIGGWTAQANVGATVSAGSFVVGRTYIILTVGSTDFTAIGASANTVGIRFTATGIGAGTGTATKAIGGVPRAMISYGVVSGYSVTVVGTTNGLYAVRAGTIYDITPAAITTNDTSRMWQLSLFGSVLLAVASTPEGADALVEWSGNTGAVATAVSPAQSALSVIATPERFLVLIGPTSGPSRAVKWATQESYSDFVATTTNSAGDFTLETEGHIQCARQGHNQTLIWTTADLWGMTYVGGEFIQQFNKLGAQCGIIGRNAVAVNDGTAFWMGHNGFYAYDGFVKPIPCDVQDYVFGSLNTLYAHLIWALNNPTFGEVTWFYPHAAQTEVTRYATYNYRENHWVTGTLVRTCGVPFVQSISTLNTYKPVLAGTTGALFDHETGSARNSEGTPSLESGPIELGDGDRLMSIQKIIPDDDTAGDVTLTIYTAPNPDTAETSNGPYTLTAQTSVRLKARQVRIKLTEAVATAWRVGVLRLGVLPSSRR